MSDAAAIKNAKTNGSGCVNRALNGFLADADEGQFWRKMIAEKQGEVSVAIPKGFNLNRDRVGTVPGKSTAILYENVQTRQSALLLGGVDQGYFRVFNGLYGAELPGKPEEKKSCVAGADAGVDIMEQLRQRIAKNPNWNGQM